jgi:hypothetical protein
MGGLSIPPIAVRRQNEGPGAKVELAGGRRWREP